MVGTTLSIETLVGCSYESWQKHVFKQFLFNKMVKESKNKHFLKSSLGFSMCDAETRSTHVCLFTDWLKHCCVESHKPWPMRDPTETCCIWAAEKNAARRLVCETARLDFQVQFSALGSCFLRSVEARQLLYGPVEWDEINQPHWVTMGFSSLFPWNP